MEFRIRPIDLENPAELDAVARNTLRSHDETIPETRGREDIPNMTFETMRSMLEQAFARLDRHCLVALDGVGNVIGHRILELKTDTNGTCYGSGFNIFIEPDSRNRGIASRLMEESDGWFRARGAEYVETGTHRDNVKMQALYAKQGYLFERHDHNGVNPIVMMRKPLRSGLRSSPAKSKS